MVLHMKINLKLSHLKINFKVLIFEFKNIKYLKVLQLKMHSKVLYMKIYLKYFI